MSDDWKTQLRPGHVVQIDPSHDPVFGGCLMIVTEVKSWGAQGCIRVPKSPQGGDAYYRCPFEKMELVGAATWLPEGTRI